MKGDFSRSTFNPRKHYSGVRMQQGRVQLDADWNENLDILRYRIETETLDVIGKCGVPTHDAAFGVVIDFNSLSHDEQTWLNNHGFTTLAAGDFYLTGGRAYVSGILVENETTLPFSQQPFVLPKGDIAITDTGFYLLYLDVWERHITVLEDPSIREVALGGPDTTTRMQVIWQARAAKVGESGATVTCADNLHPWPNASAGRLRARTHPESLPDDPCTVAPGAGYKRLENQLYRVEVHDGSDAAQGPTFKWSRDNGSIVVAVTEFSVDGSDHKIKTKDLGRDDYLGLHENDWIEILDDESDLSGKPGTLVRITNIDPDNILTLSGSVSGYDLTRHPKARRWDSGNAQAVTVPADNDGYIKLEGGIEIKFEVDTLHTGDYWLIPARTVPSQYGDIEWPKEDPGGEPAALLPNGIIHHYCKLAVLTAENINDNIAITNVEDCRKHFPPLTELQAGEGCCCSVSVGQGGDYPDIQSALDAQSQNTQAWRICLIAGDYHLAETITAEHLTEVTISGCGLQTRIIGAEGKPVFSFQASKGIRLDNLWIEASSTENAILFESCSSVMVSHCQVRNRISQEQSIGASYELSNNMLQNLGKPEPVIVVKKGFEVYILDNDLDGLPAIQAYGGDLHVSDNRIQSGGVQIVAPSVAVFIEDNVIAGGFGPGIQLGGGEDNLSDYGSVFAIPREEARYSVGSVFQPGAAQNPLAGIRLVTVSGNLIGSMQGSGIVTELSLDAQSTLSDVENLTIRDNQIIDCCREADVALGDNTSVGGGITLLGAFSTKISGNFIARNGGGFLTPQGQAVVHVPACGIFVLDGSDISITDNVIIENGTATGDPEPASYQAGIAAQYVLGNLLMTHPQGSAQDRSNSTYPALCIRGNEVVCPAGQALSVHAIGGVEVEGNTFNTRERLKQPAVPLNFREQGGCVAVFNYGVPVWYPELAPLLQMLTGQTNITLSEIEKVDAVYSRFQDGRVLFNNNRVTFNSEQQDSVGNLGNVNDQWGARAWGSVGFSTLLVALDDIGICGNQFQATVPLYLLEGAQKLQHKAVAGGDWYAYLFKFIQVCSYSTSVRATGNGFEERVFSNWYSYVSGASFMNVTTSNEATHKFLTTAPKKAEANNLSLMF